MRPGGPAAPRANRSRPSALPRPARPAEERGPLSGRGDAGASSTVPRSPPLPGTGRASERPVRTGPRSRAVRHVSVRTAVARWERPHALDGHAGMRRAGPMATSRRVRGG